MVLEGSSGSKPAYYLKRSAFGDYKAQLAPFGVWPEFSLTGLDHSGGGSLLVSHRGLNRIIADRGPSGSKNRLTTPPPQILPTALTDLFGFKEPKLDSKYRARSENCLEHRFRSLLSDFALGRLTLAGGRCCCLADQFN
jgi:hypothetical protein